MQELANGWVSLGIAIIFGVLGTISMKLSHGLKYIRPTFCLVIAYTICFIALTFAMKTLDLSVVYAVWSGVGTVLVAAIGIFFFGESVSIKKINYLCLIVIGVIGIHISDLLS